MSIIESAAKMPNNTNLARGVATDFFYNALDSRKVKSVTSLRDKRHLGHVAQVLAEVDGILSGKGPKAERQGKKRIGAFAAASYDLRKIKAASIKTENHRGNPIDVEQRLWVVHKTSQGDHKVARKSPLAGLVIHNAYSANMRARRGLILGPMNVAAIVNNGHNDQQEVLFLGTDPEYDNDPLVGFRQADRFDYVSDIDAQVDLVTALTQAKN